MLTWLCIETKAQFNYSSADEHLKTNNDFLEPLPLRKVLAKRTTKILNSILLFTFIYNNFTSRIPASFELTTRIFSHNFKSSRNPAAECLSNSQKSCETNCNSKALFNLFDFCLLSTNETRVLMRQTFVKSALISRIEVSERRLEGR